jgi:hypothetical protein
MGLEMSAKMISSYKSSIRRKGGLPRLRGRKKRRLPAEAAAAAPNGDGAISIKDLRTLKDLAVRLGPGRFRELVDFVCP